MVISGHAGPFPPIIKVSSPACPCPTESYPPSSNCTSSSTRPPPLQQRPYLSSGSLPAPEAGAKRTTSPALVSVTASRPSRNSKEANLNHPPACITPAVAADPPTSIQMIPNITGGAQQTQGRQQLESAKTFTEQYSLPDDITITPIMPPNAITNNALLMLNSSVSVILTSAPSSTTTTVSPSKSTMSTNNNNHDGLLKLNNTCNHLPTKPKEKDIVHVIDPRSGEYTTIAKHISNSSRFSGSRSDNFNKNKGHVVGKNSNMSISLVNNNNNNNTKTSHSRMETVRKLNPDLDVIVINSGEMLRNDKTENMQTINLSKSINSIPPATTLPEKPRRAQGQKPMPPLKPGRVAPNKAQPVPFSAISSSVMGLAPGAGGYLQQQQGKRVALSHNDNNFHRNGNGHSSILRVNQKKSKVNNNSTVANNSFVQSTFPNKARNKNARNASRTLSSSPTSTLTYPAYPMPSLPPGISISPGNSLDDMQPTNLSTKSYGPVDLSRTSAPINKNPYGGSQKVKAIKRSLNECIDGLQLQHQQKKLKLLEQQHAISANRDNHNNISRVHLLGNGSPPPSLASTSARTGIFNANGGKPVFADGAIVAAHHHQQQLFLQHRSPQHYRMNINKGRPPLQNPVFGQETATAARVRDPDYEQRLGGMLINSTDAVTAVSALAMDPFDLRLVNRQLGNQANGLSRKGKGNSTVIGNKFPSAMASFAFAEAKAKANKLKAKQAEKVTGKVGGGAKSKIRTRLSVKPKGLHNSQQPLGSRSRSRLLRKRSLLCNPNTGNSGNRKSESDSSICASRSSSSVRIISGAAGQQNGVKTKDREKERPRNTQAFLNATADLYQYRRSVILRVPSPKPFTPGASADGVTGGASAVANLNRTAGAEAIARFGSVSSSTPEVIPVDRTKADIPRELAAHRMAQLARTHIMANQPVSQPSLPQEMRGPVFNLPRTGSMVVNALKKRAGMKPLSPSSVNGALSQQLLLNSRRQPRWSNGWTFEGEPYEGKVFVKVRNFIRKKYFTKYFEVKTNFKNLI